MTSVELCLNCVPLNDCLCSLLTGKPGDSLPIKRKPEKLIELKRKVCSYTFSLRKK